MYLLYPTLFFLINAIVSDGATLLHRYSFNDGTANDLVGTAHGTLINNPTFSSGSIQFDPTSTSFPHVALPSQIFGTAATITVEMWANPATTGNTGWNRLFQFGNNENFCPSVHCMRFQPGGANNGRLVCGVCNNSYDGSNYDGTLAISNRQFSGAFHGVFVFNPAAGYTKVYIDSALNVQTSNTHPIAGDGASDVLQIGAAPESSGVYSMKGSVDEFRIYSGELTATEIVATNDLGPDVLPSLPTDDPTASPTSSSTDASTASPTSSSTDASTAIPTSSPTDASTAIPTSSPTDAPAARPTSISVFNSTPTCLPSLLPSITPAPTTKPLHGVAPQVLVATIVASKLYVEVTMQLSVRGTVYCAVLTSSFVPQSIDSVVLARNSAVSSTVTNFVDMVIPNLQPSTAYKLYCIAESIYGTRTSYDEMILSMLTFHTKCCKQVTIAIIGDSFDADADVVDFVSIAASGAPVDPLQVDLSLSSSTGIAVLPNPFVPSSVVIKKTSWASAARVALSGLPAGDYIVHVALSGKGAAAYEISFAGQNTFDVRSPILAPPVPVLQSAIFSEDGLSVILTFDVATNRGHQSSVFPCSRLFEFQGSAEALCQWTLASQVKVSLAGINRVTTGSSVTVRSGTVRAQCTLGERVCASWAAVATMGVAILKPDRPVSPLVMISAPSLIGPCAVPVLDFSMSTGSAGREWVSLKVSVRSDNAAAASAVNNFFANISHSSPPIAIPPELLQPGTSYDFHITLCNFFSVCSSAIHAMQVLEEAVPVVSMVGLRQRQVLASGPLLVESQAFVARCDGSKAYGGLQYSWNVYKNSKLDINIISIANDPSKFRLPAYKLDANNFYEIVVRVTSLSSELSSTASVKVWVLQSDIVAVITGGSRQTVRTGESLTLDASASYDADKEARWASSDMSFSWSCHQTEPKLSSECLLDMSIVGSKVTVTPQERALVGTVYTVAVVVADTSRQSAAQVAVGISDSSAPLISVAMKKATLPHNVGDHIAIYGTVQLSVNANVSWTLDDVSVDLFAASKTSVEAYLGKGMHTFNLVLSPHTLTGRIHPYVLSLVAGTARSSVVVNINAAPARGLFSVAPSDGFAMDTIFAFTASKWTDEDMPVTFAFGYVQSHQLTAVVRGRSESSFGSTFLPSGLTQSNNSLVCALTVFDALNAVEASETAITVNPTSLSLQSFSEMLTDQLSLAAGNLDSMKQTLSVFSSMINAKDCSLAPDCAVLFREECSDMDHTCGRCTAGHVGVEGSDNTPCIDIELLDGGPGRSFACDTDSDCGVSGHCKDQLCVKTCSHNCSGHGICHLVASNNGNTVDICQIGASYCEAICVCNPGYSGEVCAVSADAMQLSQKMRQQLLEGLQSISLVDDPNMDSILSWQASLSSITLAPDELSAEAVDVALTVASSILSQAESVEMSADNLLHLLRSIDSIVSAAAKVYVQGGAAYSSDSSRRRRLAELESTLSLLDSGGSQIAGGLVAGQSGFDSVNGMFRLTAQVVNVNSVVAIPLTDAESATGAQSSTITLIGPMKSEVEVVATSLKARLYPDSSSFLSSPMRVRLRNREGAMPSVVFTLQNSVEEDYERYDELQFINTLCEHGVVGTYNRTCLGGPAGNLLVTHKCNGTASVIETKCPAVSRLPTCHVLNSDAFVCNTTSYTAQAVVCACTFLGGASGRRNLNIISETRMSIVVVSSVFVDDFVTTVRTAEDFDSPADLQKTMLVLFLFGSMWGFGIMGVFVCSIRQQRQIRVVSSSKSDLAQMKKTAMKSKSPQAVRSYLAAYVDEIFPSVYQSKPAFSRLWDEVRKHHRYVMLITADGARSESVRMRTGVHLLTVQTMLMWVLALCYDIQFPRDTGQCGAYESEDSCLAEKSRFDADETLCRWNYDVAVHTYSCKYVKPSVSVKAMLTIAVVVSLLAAFINVIVDFLFIDVLAAPDANSEKDLETESTMQQAMARVSRVGRRLSAVSADTMNAIRYRLSWKSRKDSALDFDIVTTTVVPSSACEAHDIAIASVEELMVSAKNRLQTRYQLKVERQKSSMELQNRIKVEKHRKQLRDRLTAPISKKEGGVSELRVHDIANLTVAELMIELEVDIALQRRALPRSQREPFDDLWGIDPTGEFSKQHRTGTMYLPYQFSVEKSIKNELMFVKAESRAKFEKLRFASDMHRGIELLHLFVQDLLGRDTPAAKIWSVKCSEDFRQSMVISSGIKFAAWFAVVVINVFFVFFALLRALERGSEWQRLYFAACILQIIVEVLFYETTECAIVHYYIPGLARTEVKSAGFMLHQAIQSICSDSVDSEPQVLDAPRYLFLSTNLANKFPELFESVVVKSYHSYSPGEIGKRWRTSHSGPVLSNTLFGSPSTSRVKRSTLTSLLFSLLQKIGAWPSIVQRLLIHSTQPLAVTALVMTLVLLYRKPEMFSIPAVLVLCKLYCGFRDWWLTQDETALSSVMPASSLRTGKVPGDMPHKASEVDYEPTTIPPPPSSPPLAPNTTAQAPLENVQNNSLDAPLVINPDDRFLAVDKQPSVADLSLASSFAQEESDMEAIDNGSEVQISGEDSWTPGEESKLDEVSAWTACPCPHDPEYVNSDWHTDGMRLPFKTAPSAGDPCSEPPPGFETVHCKYGEGYPPPRTESVSLMFSGDVPGLSDSYVTGDGRSIDKPVSNTATQLSRQLEWLAESNLRSSDESEASSVDDNDMFEWVDNLLELSSSDSDSDA